MIATWSKAWRDCTKAQLVEGIDMVIEQRDKAIRRAEAAEAKVRRVEALANELDNLSRALHRGEQGPVQAGEASGLGMAAHRLRAALNDEARP